MSSSVCRLCGRPRVPGKYALCLEHRRARDRQKSYRKARNKGRVVRPRPSAEIRSLDYRDCKVCGRRLWLECFPKTGDGEYFQWTCTDCYNARKRRRYRQRMAHDPAFVLMKRRHARRWYWSQKRRWYGRVAEHIQRARREVRGR